MKHTYIWQRERCLFMGKNDWMASKRVRRWWKQEDNNGRAKKKLSIFISKWWKLCFFFYFFSLLLQQRDGGGGWVDLDTVQCTRVYTVQSKVISAPGRQNQSQNWENAKLFAPHNKFITCWNYGLSQLTTLTQPQVHLCASETRCGWEQQYYSVQR